MKDPKLEALKETAASLTRADSVEEHLNLQTQILLYIADLLNKATRVF